MLNLVGFSSPSLIVGPPAVVLFLLVSILVASSLIPAMLLLIRGKFGLKHVLSSILANGCFAGVYLLTGRNEFLGLVWLLILLPLQLSFFSISLSTFYHEKVKYAHFLKLLSRAFKGLCVISFAFLTLLAWALLAN